MQSLSRFIRDINGEKKCRYWWSFSRLVFHGLPPLDLLENISQNVILIWRIVVVFFRCCTLKGSTNNTMRYLENSCVHFRDGRQWKSRVGRLQLPRAWTNNHVQQTWRPFGRLDAFKLLSHTLPMNESQIWPTPLRTRYTHTHTHTARACTIRDRKHYLIHSKEISVR